MKRLIVGVDGSAVSRTALVWAAQIAIRSGAEIVAVNCYQPPDLEVFAEDYNRPLLERERELTEVWIVPATEAGAKVRAIVSHGDPRDVLLPMAEREGADLLVLGRTGAGGGPGFLHLGSVVEHAAHHSQISLAVIPAGCSDPIKRIVVGVDGSPESLAAIFWVAEISPALNGSVFAVQVEEPYLEWTPAASPDNWRRDIERQIAQWTMSLSESGVPVFPIAQRDLHPADGLLGVASSRFADLLVVGMRGVGGFAGLRSGGVALKLLHRANLPLVMVPNKQT